MGPFRSVLVLAKNYLDQDKDGEDLLREMPKPPFTIIGFGTCMCKFSH